MATITLKGIEVDLSNLEQLLTDAVDKDLTQPTVQESVTNDFIHLLVGAGVQLSAQQQAQISAILGAIYNVIAYFEKKESIFALLTVIVSELPSILTHL